MTVHKIQLIGKYKDKKTRLGFLSFAEKKYFSFTPNFLGYEKLRWTYHADGKYTCKNDKQTNNESSFPAIDDISKPMQLLSSCNTFRNGEPQFDMPYRKIENSTEWKIDLEKYKKQINISLYVCPSAETEMTTKNFSNMKNHQAFAYTETKPNLVVIFFEP